MVGLTRFELVTPRLSSVCSNQLSYRPPGSTSPLSTELVNEPLRSLGPIPSKLDRRACTSKNRRITSRRALRRGERLSDRSSDSPSPEEMEDSRKEVIQPQVLLQLPCYDFTPITDHTLGTCLPCGLARLLLVQPAFVM